MTTKNRAAKKDAPVPLSDSERMAFVATTRALETSAEREAALAYVLDDEEFLKRANRGAVLRAMQEGASQAARNRINTEGIQEKHREFTEWKHAHAEEYRRIKKAYAALAALWESQDGKVGVPLVRRGKSLLHALDFLEAAMEEFPALALDFPTDSPQAVRGNTKTPLAAHQKAAKASLIKAGVPKDSVEVLLFAVGLVTQIRDPARLK
jgi:hypothetical protein